MGANNLDFQGGVNKFYAGATASGRYHAHTTSGTLDTAVPALCGAKVWTEGDSPTARLDEDNYTSGSQYIECTKCEKAIRKARGA
jgi:hypothetical protein